MGKLLFAGAATALVIAAAGAMLAMRGSADADADNAGSGGGGGGGGTGAEPPARRVEPLVGAGPTYSSDLKALEVRSKHESASFSVTLGECADGKRFLRDGHQCFEGCGRVRYYFGEMLVGVVTTSPTGSGSNVRYEGDDQDSVHCDIKEAHVAFRAPAGDQ
jgi:hypothetical protein